MHSFTLNALRTSAEKYVYVASFVSYFNQFC